MTDQSHAASTSGLTPLAAGTIRRLFERRHEHPLMRSMCRASIRDARLWLRYFRGN